MYLQYTKSQISQGAIVGDEVKIERHERNVVWRRPRVVSKSDRLSMSNVLIIDEFFVKK